MSAVEDKIRRRLQEKVNQYQAEIDTLNRTKQELVEGSAKIDSIISRMEREQVSLNMSKILQNMMTFDQICIYRLICRKI